MLHVHFSPSQVSSAWLPPPEQELQWVILGVSDQGIGFLPEQVEYLFQPFTQADDSATRRYGGTGLGLAITKEFCELMGGHIHINSTAKQGSTVTLRLPLEIK